MPFEYVRFFYCLHCGKNLNYRDPSTKFCWDGMFCNNTCRNDYFINKKETHKTVQLLYKEIKELKKQINKINVIEDKGLQITQT